MAAHILLLAVIMQVLAKIVPAKHFYYPYAAQELALANQEELGVEIVPFQEMVYSHQQEKYFPIDQFPANETPAAISGTELRERLNKNQDIPDMVFLSRRY